MVQISYILAPLAIVSYAIAAPHHHAAESKLGRINGAGHPGGVSASNAAATGTSNKALYFLSNVAQNSVIALKINTDGTLSEGSITPTGGAGGNGLEANGDKAGPDALFSQSALKVEGNMLVAVNAGSNTLSLFKIDAADPTKLTMIGQPADTLGEFPVTVALSPKRNLACVGNTGKVAGVACFSVCPKAGLKLVSKSLLAFDINQTTPPVGPENTVSQVFFNADSSALFTTVKGNPAVNNTGFLSVLPIANGVPASRDIRSSPPGTAVLFGTVLVPGSNDLFATDASFGAATLSVSGTGVASVVSKAVLDDQTATCWATISAKTNTGFVTDVGINRVVEIDPASGKIIKETNLADGNPGLIDLVSGGNFIYALSPGNATVPTSIEVLDVSGGPGSAKPIQSFRPQGADLNAQGLTIL